MRNRLITVTNNLLNKIISYEGISERTLQYKKTYWVAIVLVTVYVIGMTILAIKLDVNNLVMYGFTLLAFYFPFILLFAVIPKKLLWLVHISQHMALIVTFFFVIKMGGIPHCGGIFLASLCSVIFSILFYSVAWSLWYFALFIICTASSYFIQYIYNFPSSILPETNNLFFFINTLSISGLILAIVLIYLDQYTRYEKKEAIRQKELNEAKTRLYTNITHEFRTPLTVILGLADSIKPDLKHKTKTDTIIRNGKNLLQLVDQMLDLSKLESGNFKINKIHGNIIPFLRYIFQLQEYYAMEKELRMTFKAKSKSYDMDFDPEKTTTIVSNLLSNAIKFTPSGGKVDMTVGSSDGYLVISVKDTGIGIPKQHHDKIFERFHQVDDKNIRKTGGTGIGLALTKELVTLLNGTIKVKSSPGIETIFTLKIPITSQLKEVIKEEEEITDYSGTITGSGILTKEKQRLLIIEDNKDVISYLVSCYKQEFKIDVVTDGKQGVDLALKKIPDIIISDVMMPEMDGFELCKTLKEDYRTSHIPIILLTAKADIASRIKGLEQGADAYVVKPFNKQELLVRIRKLLELRHNLYQRYSKGKVPELSPVPSIQREDKFYSKITELILNNLHDENFGVQTLCSEMAMSKSQLYRKFKALTNNSVASCIRTLRLQKARQLLKTTSLNITEVSYEVGMKSLSTFSQLFKEEFGESPKIFAGKAHNDL